MPSTSLDIECTPRKSSTSRLCPESTRRWSCSDRSRMSPGAKRISASRMRTTVTPATDRTLTPALRSGLGDRGAGPGAKAGAIPRVEAVVSRHCSPPLLFLRDYSNLQ